MINRSKSEVASLIKNFLNGKGNPWDWDEFTSIPILSKELDMIRKECVSLPDLYPPNEKGNYCNDSGIKRLRIMLENLKS